MSLTRLSCLHYCIKHTTNRHSSPKHYSSRSTNSPKIQEYRPNINDLKQFFDDTKRSSHSKKQSSYSDAKPTYMLQDEIFFDGKNRSEFEKVKQKFDRSQSSKIASFSSNSKNSNNFHSKSFEARNDVNQKRHVIDDYGMKSNMNINDNIPHQYDCEASSSSSKKHSSFHAQSSHEKQENTIDLTASFNLDGFKVSEDDDDDDVSCA